MDIESSGTTQCVRKNHGRGCWTKWRPQRILMKKWKPQASPFHKGNHWRLSGGWHIWARLCGGDQTAALLDAGDTGDRVDCWTPLLPITSSLATGWCYLVVDLPSLTLSSVTLIIIIIFFYLILPFINTENIEMWVLGPGSPLLLWQNHYSEYCVGLGLWSRLAQQRHTEYMTHKLSCGVCSSSSVLRVILWGRTSMPWGKPLGHWGKVHRNNRRNPKGSWLAGFSTNTDFP